MQVARTKKNPPYTRFLERLDQARAHARTMAEIAVYDDDPKAWLRNGPGKEKEGDPGWTSIVKPVMHSETNINMLANPEFNALWSLILKALKNYPEARVAILEAIQSFEPNKVVNAIAQATNKANPLAFTDNGPIVNSSSSSR